MCGAWYHDGSWDSREEHLMMAIQVKRDSFARATLMRDKAPANTSCNWCGQPAKWFYYWESDSSYQCPAPSPKVFCSVGCYRIYNT